MRWAHWEQAVGQLEAGVLLAHDEQALAGVRLRRRVSRVVGGVLKPGVSGFQGSATPTAKMPTWQR